MDHSHHAGHHDMAAEAVGPMCKMHMLWNWETIDTCVVFRSWHVHNMAQFIITIIIIVLIGVAFEWLRKVQKSYDAKLAASSGGAATTNGTKRSRSPPRHTPGDPVGPTVHRLGTTPRLIRAALYGLLVFISFFIMLIFMTYNGYLVLAVVAGAVIGHYILNDEIAVDETSGGAIGGNGMACH